MMLKNSVIAVALSMTAVVSAHAQAVLAAETNIEKNAYIATRSGHYTLVVQGDGNVVTYFNGVNMTRPAGFSTGTDNGDHLRMQMDGNLALYKSNGTWAWNAGTGGKPYNMGYKLVLYETGRLAILDANNSVVKELVRIDTGTREGGAVNYYPFRKIAAFPGGGCVDGVTPLMQNGADAAAWASAAGGTIGYCGSPY
nr:hypothetical protein [uncultured Duganella sp.]